MQHLIRIKLIRSILGYSQAQMGKVLGVSQNAYCNYENGNRELSVEKLASLSHFGISSDWLLTGSINENHSYEIITAMQHSGTTPEELSKKLDVPVAFLNAIQEKTISPSVEFFTRAVESMGYKPHGAQKDAVDKGKNDYLEGGSKYYVILQERIKGYQNEVELLGNALDKEQKRCTALEKEIEELRDENTALKKRLPVQREPFTTTTHTPL